CPETVLKVVRLSASKNQRQHRWPREASPQIAESDFAELLAADDLKAGEQIGAVQINVAAHIMAIQDIERPPAQEGAEHRRPADRYVLVFRCARTERNLRAVPKPNRDGQIEDLREVPHDPPRRLKTALF